MKTSLTLESLWFNNSLRNFFFRKQAWETLEDLVANSSLSDKDTLEHLDDYYNDYDLDDVEEMFYSESVEYIANDCGLALTDDDESDK